MDTSAPVVFGCYQGTPSQTFPQLWFQLCLCPKHVQPQERERETAGEGGAVDMGHCGVRLALVTTLSLQHWTLLPIWTEWGDGSHHPISVSMYRGSWGGVLDSSPKLVVRKGELPDSH